MNTLKKTVIITVFGFYKDAEDKLHISKSLIHDLPKHYTTFDIIVSLSCFSHFAIVVEEHE